MATKQEVLAELVAMSRHLGEPARDYAILGEGNTSARIDETSFFVKASGAELATITGEQFVEMDFERTLALLDKEKLSDAEICDGLLAARADLGAKVRPSVETLFHAVLLNGSQLRVAHRTVHCVFLLIWLPNILLVLSFACSIAR